MRYSFFLCCLFVFLSSCNSKKETLWIHYDVGISVKIQPNKWYVCYYSSGGDVLGGIRRTNEFEIIKVIEVYRKRGVNHILFGKAMTFNFLYDNLPLTFCEIDTTFLIQNHYKDIEYWEFCVYRGSGCIAYFPIEDCGF